MKLTRSQSLALAGGTLLLFFMLSVFLSPKSELATTATTSGQPTASSSETPSNSRFVLGTFERSEIRDGKKLWEIKAQHGEYFPESNSATVEDALLTLYREDKPVELQAAHATITLSGATLSKADLSGGVKMIYIDQNITVDTPTALIDMPNNQVSAPGNVVVVGPDFELRGDKFSGDLKTHNFKLLENVSTVLRPRSKEK